MNPFDFVKSINNKQYMMDETNEKEYKPWLVNKAMSYFPETLMYSNQMNMTEASNKMQYDYYIHSVKKGNRFSKWHKPEKDEAIELLCLAYNYGRKEAKIALKTINPCDLERIRKSIKG